MTRLMWKDRLSGEPALFTVLFASILKMEQMLSFDPFMPMDFSTINLWTGPFRKEGASG